MLLYFLLGDFMQEYDVIVVGGSVAGLRAAEQLAKKGLNVLCLDKKQEIGVPKQCGEGISLNHLRRLHIKPQSRWAVQKIKGAALYAPNGKKVEIDFGKTMGFVIERKMFEKYLAKKASKAGATIKVRSNVTSVKRIKGGVEVRVSDLFSETYKAKIVFACDGPQSSIANMLGLSIKIKPEDLDSGIQYEMTNIEFEQPELIHLWFGNNVAPRGYVWLFPKGKDHANVGVGIGAHIKGSAKAYLDKWIEKRSGIKKGSIVEVNSGVIPVGGLLEKMTSDNLIVVGDAAHQVNPIHGGGMGLAMESADIGASVAAKAFEENDFSNKMLDEYNRIWWEKYGKRLMRILQIRYMVESLNDKDFNAIAESFTGEEIMLLQSGELAKSKKLIVKKLIKKPRLVKVMLRYLTSSNANK
ncbi:MAG: NAD(P)/FAD-dependent oxidoreductase [Candidatus Iainarchaeum archaeon]|uniref:NAD(P)/FAD-dependent oxidoreductase n=1 Tax=Candidatus Iainarchaeum sp. TaxID=3101447 RepID=A0A497JGU6_9ARCH|nr:MAG: NAD(P)/FAD-dependent oxidoreductase [Candidatus Diapherotrites archaeon]